MKHTRRFHRGLLLVVGSLAILSFDSCTVYKDPLLVKYDDLEQRRQLEAVLANSHTPQPPAPAPSKPVEPDPPTKKILACDKFVMPTVGEIPRLTPQQIAVVTSTNDVKVSNTILVDELEKIYKYTSTYQKALEAAMTKHTRSCHRVTVEK
jgi:hypothetical protein